MAARKRRGVGEGGWSDNVRERIKSSMLVNALTEHVLGNREMSASQVTAGLGLLRKTLPDLTAVTRYSPQSGLTYVEILD